MMEQRKRGRRTSHAVSICDEERRVSPGSSRPRRPSAARRASKDEATHVAVADGPAADTVLDRVLAVHLGAFLLPLLAAEERARHLAARRDRRQVRRPERVHDGCERGPQRQRGALGQVVQAGLERKKGNVPLPISRHLLPSGERSGSSRARSLMTLRTKDCKSESVQIRARRAREEDAPEVPEQAPRLHARHDEVGALELQGSHRVRPTRRGKEEKV